MKAVCWYGTEDVRVENVPEPEILNPRDAIVRITATAICGSDLHLYDGYIPTMEKGDILGHEFMGEVVEVGREVRNLKKGDRVVVPFTISCGRCFFCKQQLWSLCDNSNPNVDHGGEVLRPLLGRAVRVLAPVRRLRRAGRRNTRACPSPTSARSKSTATSATTRCSSSPTSSPPATWRRRTATSSRATRWRCGAAGRSGSSPSAARSCWARSA